MPFAPILWLRGRGSQDLQQRPVLSSALYSGESLSVVVDDLLAMVLVAAVLWCLLRLRQIQLPEISAAVSVSMKSVSHICLGLCHDTSSNLTRLCCLRTDITKGPRHVQLIDQSRDFIACSSLSLGRQIEKQYPQGSFVSSHFLTAS